ncbi:cellulase family glycosylhydrolase, partial [Singulisphaera rosea]
MPDSGTTQFWADPNVGAAKLFANNPAVMFGPFNEPELVDWNTYRNGGWINDGPGYNSPGMQGLLDAIRGTGANNIVSPEGKQWAHDLSGISQGYGLTDPAGNLMYQLHLYPNEWQKAADGDQALLPVAGKYPVYIGEFGTLGDASDPGTVGVAQPSPAVWTQNMIAWANQHVYSWTAWSFTPDSTPCLLADWNYTPTSYFGSYVKSALAQQAPPATTPANDAFTHRATITGSSASVTGSNVNATREASEPTIVG